MINVPAKMIQMEGFLPAFLDFETEYLLQNQTFQIFFALKNGQFYNSLLFEQPWEESMRIGNVKEDILLVPRVSETKISRCKLHN